MVTVTIFRGRCKRIALAPTQSDEPLLQTGLGAPVGGAGPRSQLLGMVGAAVSSRHLLRLPRRERTVQAAAPRPRARSQRRDRALSPNSQAFSTIAAPVRAESSCTTTPSIGSTSASQGARSI